MKTSATEIIERVHECRMKLANVLEDEEYDGIRELFEELYPDKAHFIYELLQNAEDAQATNATFSLSDVALEFEHDGQPFSEGDLSRITNYAKKGKGPDAIGRFGVGFKAVYAYTDTPRIWSPTFSFKITDRVLPTEIEALPGLGKLTRFEFPFDSAKKSKAVALQEIRTGLEELSELSLLFLSHIESISWNALDGPKVEVLRIKHSDHHFEVLKQAGNETVASSHFLVFSERVDGLPVKELAVAFPLEVISRQLAVDTEASFADSFRIVPALPGAVFVYFPAAKESSGLRFHIHAPFVPDVSRASIKETPANQALKEQIAALIANHALPEIRDLDLLTTDFLAVLPIPEDTISSSYDVIREKIRDAMTTGSLIPALDETHAPARDLVRGRRALKDLLTDDDLSFLLDRQQTPVKWAKSASQKNSRADRFLSDLITKELTRERFIQIIVDKAYRSCDTDFMEWLRAKPLPWHQQFYATLYGLLDERRRWDDKWDRISRCKVVRLRDGGYESGRKCHFPSDELEEGELLGIVDERVYRSGDSKEQRDEARKFLEAVGVREVDEVEKIKALLKSNYTKNRNTVPIDWKKYEKDLKRFMTLCEKDKGHAELFRDYYVLQREDGSWVKPRDVYLDSPYQDTRLSAFYGTLPEERRARTKLGDAYLNFGIDYERLVAFASAVGVADRLEIQRFDESTKSGERLKRLRNKTPGNHTRFEEYQDYFIEGLDDAISSRCVEVSELVWETLAECDFDWWKAKYRKNRDRGYVSGLHSHLANQLMDSEWIPQKDGTFVRPADALRERLPSGFHIDTGWEWLDRIGFESYRRRAEQEESERTVDTVDEERRAKEAGFKDRESMERARRFSELPEEEQEKVLEEYERRAPEQLPNHQSPNPDRRASRVHEEGLRALERKYEQRSRSVSVDPEGTKKQAGEYLRHQYSDGEGTMICQVCQGELPFKLPSGEYYFEKVRFLDELVRNHRENYLALCPLHAAMYMHARTSPKSLLQALKDLNGRELKVTLAEKSETIYFTTNHINDIRAKVKSEEKNLSRCGRIDGQSRE